jgi:creatinine amidohydrolase/Fe(II)-dependent formamide hydrolase-like protein
MLRIVFFILLLVVIGQSVCAATAAASLSNRLEDLTWTEVQQRIEAGSTTALVPIGGTEQSGPYMALGKHNARAALLADKIAKQLGNALVAPVLSYVPEGSIRPPAAHMRWAGTLSISDEAFKSILESTARSLKQHGFREVFFLGDHGGYQKDLTQVADKLNREWATDPACRAYALLEYYRVTQTAYVAELRRLGFSDAEIGTHAGLADTALTLALDPSMVRSDAMSHSHKLSQKDGVYGDPHRATVDLGQIGVQQIVQTSVSAIQAMSRIHK